MTTPRHLTIRLLSDSTFAATGFTPGEVDIEIDHNELGLPRLSGKTLHGLLRDTWLGMQHAFADERHREAATRIFGPAGEFEETAILRVGDASLDEATRSTVRDAVHRADDPLSPWDILHALTDIRSQTSEARETDAPATGTLRSTRVLLRDIVLFSPLTWLSEPSAIDLEVLALSALASRNAGLARNRGRGHVEILLDGDAHTTRTVGGIQ